MNKLEVRIKHEGHINSLSKRWDSFIHLRKFPKNDNRKWKINGKIGYCTQCIVIGKTGYGKSSTLNTIVGENHFEVSDIKSTTRFAQSTEWLIETGFYFSFVDLPGIGENREFDLKYLELYKDMLNKSDCVLYILRADQRDYSVDFNAISELNINAKKLIIGLNFCDKIEPLSREYPFNPSAEQLLKIEKKVVTIADIFNIDINQIVPYSATGKWNLKHLVETLVFAIYPLIDH